MTIKGKEPRAWYMWQAAGRLCLLRPSQTSFHYREFKGLVGRALANTTPRERHCVSLRRLDSSPSLTTDWMICSLSKFVTTCFLIDLTQTVKISKAMQSGHGSWELGNAHAESGPCRDPSPFRMQLPFPLFCLEDSKWLHKRSFTSTWKLNVSIWYWHKIWGSGNIAPVNFYGKKYGVPFQPPTKSEVYFWLMVGGGKGERPVLWILSIRNSKWM